MPLEPYTISFFVELKVKPFLMIVATVTIFLIDWAMSFLKIFKPECKK